jgi:hypothetical protein
MVTQPLQQAVSGIGPGSSSCDAAATVKGRFVAGLVMSPLHPTSATVVIKPTSARATLREKDKDFMANSMFEERPTYLMSRA